MSICPVCGHDRRLIFELKVCDRCDHAARATENKMRYASDIYPRRLSKQEMDKALSRAGIEER